MRMIPLICLALGLILGWTFKVVSIRPSESPTTVTALKEGSFHSSKQNRPTVRAPKESSQSAAQNVAPVATAMTFEAMMAELSQLKTAHERELLLQGFVQAKGKIDAKEAIALMRQLPAGDLRDSAIIALLGQKTGRSTSQMSREVTELGAEGALLMHLMSAKEGSPEQIAGLAKELLSGKARTEVLASAASLLAASNPQAAFDLGNGLVGNQQITFLQRFAEGWGEANADAAFQWAARIPDDQTSALMRTSIAEAYARRDPIAAARWATSLPPGDADRGQFLATVADEWAQVDTVAAQEWAQQLSNAADQSAAQGGIQKHAIVGVGIALDRTPEGFQVNELIQGGAAQLSGVVHAKDIILAVSDDEGGWIDTRALPEDELLDFIRGAPQSYVSLKVKSATDEAPRTVTLARNPIIMRPR